MVVCLWSKGRCRGLAFGRTLGGFFCHRMGVRRFFVIGGKLGRYAVILEIDGLDEVKISNRGVERLYSRIEAFVQREYLFNQFGRDRSRHLTARLRSLYQDRQRDLWVVIWRKREKPGVIVFLAVSSKLGGSSFSGPHNSWNLGA